MHTVSKIQNHSLPIHMSPYSRSMRPIQEACDLLRGLVSKAFSIIDQFGGCQIKDHSNKVS